MKTVVVLLLCVLAELAQGQDDIWDMLFVDITEPCMRENANSSLWYLTVHCKNYGGTVGCMNIDPETKVGTCHCNLGPDAYFDDSEEIRSCVGKVDSVCTSEYTGSIPQKRCTPNAECLSLQEEGHSVGRCRCVYGYKEDEERMCIPDEDIEDRSTPRTTTTTEKGEMPPFKLPIITGMYGVECHVPHLLNYTICDTHGDTVSCIDNQCQCNLGEEDSIFDEELDKCVSLVGSYCLARWSVWGGKYCTSGADCFPSTGAFEEGYSFGTCQCLYGYTENADGTCTRNSGVTDPSTVRPTEKPTLETTTEDGGSSSTTEDGGSSSSTTEDNSSTSTTEGETETTTEGEGGPEATTAGAITFGSGFLLTIFLTTVVTLFM